jgi:hypothetical protein
VRVSVYWVVPMCTVRPCACNIAYSPALAIRLLATFRKAASTLKVTIDSTEPLTDTLRVVGALYNVTLEVTGDATSVTSSSDNAGKASSTAAAESRTGGARAARRSSTGKRARSGASKARPASTSTVRAWARENGYDIASRGRVPADVVAAYRKSQSSG